MNPTQEQLQATINEARVQLNKIQDKERRAEHSAMVGKCFRYKDNSYGSGSGKWDVYYKVTGGTNSYYPKAFSFQTDCNGHIRIEPDTFLSVGNQPIENSLFDREWARVQKRVAGLLSQPASAKKKAKQTA